MHDQLHSLLHTHTRGIIDEATQQTQTRQHKMLQHHGIVATCTAVAHTPIHPAKDIFLNSVLFPTMVCAKLR